MTSICRGKSSSWSMMIRASQAGASANKSGKPNVGRVEVHIEIGRLIRQSSEIGVQVQNS